MIKKTVRVKFLVLALSPFAFVGGVGCSSAPTGPDNTHPPAWATGPARTVDGGYIIYVGSGEDANLDRAHFKAEAMALQDLANECSMDPKGARIEDHYDQDVGVLHKSYAKVAVEFQVCEEARNAVTPEDIRKLASEPMTAEVKRYQDEFDEPEEEETLEPTQLASNPSNSSGSSGPSSGHPYSGGGFFIASGPQYYVVSQQVAYVKQNVILAPPAQYPPQAAITQQPVAAIAPAQTAVNQYAAANPGMRSATAPAFSQARPNATAHQPEALRQPISQRPESARNRTQTVRGSQARSAHSAPHPGHGQGSRKKKRRHP